MPPRIANPIFLIIVFILVTVALTAFGCKKSGEETAEPIPPASTGALPAPASQGGSQAAVASPVSSAGSNSASEDLEGKFSKLATDFTELWGTFSSASNCQNIRDLLAYMSVSFRAEMEDYLQTKCGRSPGTFFEWKTKVLDTVVLKRQQDAAEILVITRREQNRGGSQKVYYSNLILKLIVGTNAEGLKEWRVDDASWTE